FSVLRVGEVTRVGSVPPAGGHAGRVLGRACDLVHVVDNYTPGNLPPTGILDPLVAIPDETAVVPDAPVLGDASQRAVAVGLAARPIGPVEPDGQRGHLMRVTRPREMALDAAVDEGPPISLSPRKDERRFLVEDPLPEFGVTAINGARIVRDLLPDLVLI